ncbi:MAG: winged helix-turn-helix transcriptional regulator [Parvibaculaceae bacterium]
MAKEAKLISREVMSDDSETRVIARELLDHVGDALTLKVTLRLHEGSAGLDELRQSIDGISQRKLALSLRELIRNGLALRKHSETFPSRTLYSLTPLGVMFVAQVTGLMRWVDEHGAEIRSARSQFRERAYKWLGPSRLHM